MTISTPTPALKKDTDRLPVKVDARNKTPPVQRATPSATCACGGGCPRCSGKSNRMPGVLQAKLQVGAPKDRFEVEADCVADQVMSNPEQSIATNNAPQRIQRLTKQSSAMDTEAPESVEHALTENGAALAPGLQQEMEKRFGYDFSGVRIHSNTTAAQSAQDVDAHAYTVGNHIVFGAGEFSPNSRSGQRLLAHELTHVVQQSTVTRPPAVDTHGGTNSAGVVQRQISNTGSQPVLQRDVRRGSAGGCGICLGGDSRIAGGIAHTEVQSAFTALNPDMVAERIVPTVPDTAESPFSPELDLSYEAEEDGQHVIYIGEIKPLDDAGRQAGEGRRKLQDYARELSFSYDAVFRMEDEPPPGPLFFANPANPSGCPPQMIYVQLTEPGLYQYYCDPPWSTLVRNPACACRPRRRRREEERRVVPNPVPLPLPLPLPETSPLPIPSGGSRPLPAPAPGPAPGPVPDPGPTSDPVPGPSPAPDPGGGGEVIPFPGRPPIIEEDPIPIAARDAEAVLREIREFIDRVVRTGEEAEEAARRFLEQHPEVYLYLAGACFGIAAVIVVATLIEDIATAGAGIADDPASFAAALALIRIAMQMQQMRPG